MTYSIVARDPATGALGVAVQSHFFGVGPVVPWLRAGVGAVATQAAVNVSLGPRGVEMLAAGQPAEEVLRALVDSDPGRGERQLGVVDRAGRAAAYTGAACIADAGHLVGEGFAVQGNLLRSAAVWPAMAEAWVAGATLRFWERLLAVLDAGEAAGGDVRGRQSAALVIVDGTVRDATWDGTIMNVRVDDHPDPLVELRRLARMSEAYRIMGELESANDDARPVDERYADARRLAPEAMELVFWRGVELGAGGDVAAARDELALCFAADPTWREALRRVAAAGLAGDDPERVAALLELAEN